MALSNILNEPRKELRESAIGIIAILPLLWIDWHYSVMWATPKRPDDIPFFVALPVALLVISTLMVVAVAILIGLLVFTHWLGEEIIELVKP